MADGNGTTRHMDTYRVRLGGSTAYADLVLPDNLTAIDVERITDFLGVLRVHQAETRRQSEAAHQVMVARRRAEEGT